ncbi:tryptophan halogenase family protein [Nitrospirillum sp. BR 11828]|uniref:tryptophan halogenase family protein n=1 Tax=Nitrospirillum sp. BR 11828 TaxID=3104325 RepID=UPI002ACAF242|nr:tryptophan halogenase family protein [Nitrospirillum sp. BR 11828]MDZ5648347.1 tryptophan halogenase family protein [Nitrospirillum sp. BR 11828]
MTQSMGSRDTGSPPVRDVLIVGGGTAGWLTAAYLARTLAISQPGGARISLVESPDIGILGVGEGTFPSIQRTLRRIGIDESVFMRESEATFKQGIRFDHWVRPPNTPGRSHYFHPFESAITPEGMDLLPYWLLGHAGDDIGIDAAVTVQKGVADASLAPKRPGEADYAGALNYAYHFDAVKFARLLRTVAIDLGVRHVVDTVDAVPLAEDGTVAGVLTHQHGPLTADLYIDCTGFTAQLIGQALKSPYQSCRQWLFCDRAVALQVPYDRPDAPIPSYTLSTAQEAGWTWDIGLESRRGTGHVYSSDHTDDTRAEQVLRDYIGPAANGKTARTFRFEAGFRPKPWVGNCVAIGLSGGFFEPLESTGIVMIEVAAVLLTSLFPWAGDMATAARQFNRVMRQRYERAADFLKLHYCLTRRTDTAFWRDNADAATLPDTLRDLLDRWRHRPPEGLDFDLNLDTFSEASWRFVLYGMEYGTDLTAQAGAFRHKDEARRHFAAIRAGTTQALAALPRHRDLIQQIYRHGLRPRPSFGTAQAGPSGLSAGMAGLSR